MTSLLKTAGKILAMAFAVVVLALVVAYASGTVWVDVQEKRPGGHRVVFAVPSALVTLGLRFIPEAELREDSTEWRKWLPAVAGAGDVLEKCPDVQFIEVRGPAESVSVAKRGGSLVVDVDDAGERAHVSFPTSLVHSVAEGLRDRGGPN